MSRTSERPHPLAEYTQQIDPDRVYTVRQLAEILELSPSSVQGMARSGWLPGSRMRPHRRGGRVHTWSGAQLLRIANRPVKVTFDHDRYAAATLYRVGCRCPLCVRAHSKDSLQRRHALAEEAFPYEARRRVLELVEAQMPVSEAAAEVGVTLRQVYGRANWDAGFAEDLDEAAWSLCVLGEDDPACATPSGYRGSANRPACRATGCREWRRAQARQERAAA
ncbi:helix-turn-helix domain-containing protein [Streptomyces sp. NPDC050485]|uniref:helix-turn-helix domain-containing protein n=1 Tax=Streptomyces sp. NPDC050485 TaxID=3365617 RepID=UPI003792F7BA